MRKYAYLPILVVLLTCGGDTTAPPPPDTAAYTLDLVTLTYAFAYCGTTPDTSRILAHAPNSFAVLEMQNGNFKMEGLWRSILETGDTAIVIHNYQTGSYWIYPDSIKFVEEGGTMYFGRWVMLLIEWQLVEDGLVGKHLRACEEEGNAYYADITARWKLRPTPSQHVLPPNPRVRVAVPSVVQPPDLSRERPR